MERPEIKVRPKIICVDWDSTCVRYGTDEVLPGAMMSLFKLIQLGWSIVIHTSRKDARPIWDILKSHGFDVGGLQEKGLLTVSMMKPDARIYLDDRAMQFHGEWSDDVMERIESFMPWHILKEDKE